MSVKQYIFLCLSSALLAISCRQSGYVTLDGYTQGGTYTVKYNSDGLSEKPADIHAHIEDLLSEIDSSISGYNKGSYLSRRNEGEAVGRNSIYDELCDISEEYVAMSDGAFDPWAAPLFDVWGFGFTADSLPPDDALLRAMEECKEKNKVNFNAIAQGYSCDMIARYLYSIGVKDMLVDIGEIYCDGVNASGKGWKIGIDAPFDGNNIPGASLSGVWQSDGGPHGVVTSGNYRKFYIKDGHKYSHTIDPRTGYPVTHDLLSATVIAPSAAEADALATYFMVIGEDGAKDFAQNHSGIEACLISSEDIWVSEGFYGNVSTESASSTAGER